MDTNPGEDPELLRNISAALEMCDQGLEPPVEEICKGRPDLIPAVARAVELAQRLPSLQRDTLTFDSYANRILDGRYQLNAVIGAGSMGVVYSAQDLELNRQVAVKLLRSDVLTIEEAEERFQREAEVLAAVQHHSVVTVFDRGYTEEGGLFIVMELIDGCPLSDLLELATRRGKPSQHEDVSWMTTELGDQALTERSYLRTVVRWAADLAGGLKAAHELGIFHRDIKPSNILIRRVGPPALIDFGIAARDAKATANTRDGSLGTPVYMAPEAIESHTIAGPGLDIYGLSATLYHMLTLRAPFSGTPSQVLANLARRDPRPAYRLRPGMPRDLQAILDCGMARQRTSRYATAADLESDLRAFLDHAPVMARPISALRRWLRVAWASNAFRVAVAAVVIVLAGFAATAWHAGWIETRTDQELEARAHIPPALTLWSPINRKITSLDEYRALSALLDRASSVCVEPIPSRLLRGSFRLDHGDPVGAATDMEAVASFVGTAYAKALAEAYKALPPDTEGFPPALNEGLPAARTSLDLYLAAYHKLRGGRSMGEFAEARDLLLDPGLEKYIPANEVLVPLLVSLAAQGRTQSERTAGFQAAYDRAIRLEARIGRRTGLTAHGISASLVGQGLYEEALAPLRDGIALVPSYHGLHSNLAISARRRGLYEESLAACKKVAQLRPQFLKNHETLIRALIDSDRFDEARSALDQAPFQATDQDQRSKQILLGEIEYSRVLALLVTDEAAAHRVAELALQQFDEVAKYGEPFGGRERDSLEAILAGDRFAAFGAHALRTAEDPTNYKLLTNMVRFMPHQFTDEQASALHNYLVSLLNTLAPRSL